MRGRYPGIPAATIDQILALFPSKDAINGGEFFAALRLVLHVEAGKDVDRALAFVQVHPGSAAVTGPPVSAPAASQATAPAPEDVPEAPPTRTPQRHNPFLPPTTTTPSLVQSLLLLRLPQYRPPRHPPLPPRTASPPKPSTPAHITSTLMKQSLQASKTGQWLKQGQARLEQERVLQVLRSTSSTPRPAAATTAADDYIASSLEQVALASPSNSLQRSAFDDAYRDREPPPLHPDHQRKSAPPSVSSRSSRASASGSSGSSSRRVRRSPERESSPFDSPAPQTQTRLMRSNSLRPSPPPPGPFPSASRAHRRPESVHALLGGLGPKLNELKLAAAEGSPFGDPVRARARKEEREGLVSRQAPEVDSDSSSDDDDVDGDADGGWVGVRRHGLEDSDVDAEVPGGRRKPVRRDTAIPRERDSLKWPVDVEGEGWRPL
ncbi:hypothetical protein MVEN_02500900 [Mycena venus]|uniref:Uncharacterized protein n=1 Tax=Mycena venus TaxID=2733690 RepID=A0A8H6U067_9AGAR|nr:hypothetical protein MVEN_02500900 [Mycena venus]